MAKMKAGDHFDAFRLQHGDTVRTFHDVTVGHPFRRVWHDDPDIDGARYYEKEPIEDRWELVGTELKTEVGGSRPGNQEPETRIIKVQVRVGFDPENVVTE